MLFDYRDDIKSIIERLNDEITLTAIRLEEDPRNKKLAEALLEVRADELDKALSYSKGGSEPALLQAVEFAGQGLLKLEALYQHSKNPTHPYKLVVEDESRTLPFLEMSLIYGTLGNIALRTYAALKYCDADMERYKTLESNDAPKSLEAYYLGNLDESLRFTAGRISEPMHEDANGLLAIELHRLSQRLHEASGGGLVSMLVDRLDPSAALSAPPPPTPEQVVKKYDHIFTDIQMLLERPTMKNIVPHRDTIQCRLSAQGSQRFIKEDLKNAVRYLEGKGFQFPIYHKVADRGKNH